MHSLPAWKPRSSCEASRLEFKEPGHSHPQRDGCQVQNVIIHPRALQNRKKALQTLDALLGRPSQEQKCAGQPTRKLQNEEGVVPWLGQEWCFEDIGVEMQQGSKPAETSLQPKPQALHHVPQKLFSIGS